MTMDLSVIIVNFNTADLTQACIESILASGSKLTIEIIVVDNGSSQKLKLSKSADLRLLANTSNLGFAKANNQGIKIARGEYLLLLNSDTKVKPKALDHLVGFARANPDAGVVGAKLLNLDGSVQASCLRLPTLARTLKHYWLGQKGLLDKYVPKPQVASQVEAVVGAAFLITPAALDKIRSLDERYFMYYEDLEYCKQVKKIGLKVYYLPTAQIIHYHGASGKNLASDVNQWRRLIVSSKIYHGSFAHYLIYLLTWTHQKVSTIWKRYLFS